LIPNAYLQEWSAHAPWPDLNQVEQDLIICRALCDLFSNVQLKGKIAFRGGTSMHKLLFAKPLRYSEDIDLVQTQAEPIGATIDGIRQALSWLGKPKREQVAHSMHLVFKFTPEADAGSQLKLKVEINTREHVNLHGLKAYPFELSNGWHQAKAEIVSFEPEEIFGTKLRALLQRHKNRDLFDLNQGLLQLGLDCDRVIGCFQHYLAMEGHPITRANAEERMLMKLNQSLTEDIAPLLPVGVSFTDDDAIAAFGRVWKELISRIPGDPWKSSQMVIDEIRKTKIPALLSGVQ
jgi:predicted nucleotidyltransferase component of viral defense system